MKTKTLKYTVIRSKKQYDSYCRKLQHLIFSIPPKSKEVKNEIALLTVLIEKWDIEHSTFQKLSPIQLLQSLMIEHNMKAVHLASLLKLSEGQISDILHYKKGLSKKSIRILAEHFKMNQAAFNRYYPLKTKYSPSHTTLYSKPEKKSSSLAAETETKYNKGKTRLYR